MTARGRRWCATALLLPLSLVVLTGCGVTTEDQPEPLDRTSVPAPPTPTVRVMPDSSPSSRVPAPGPT